MPFSPLNGLQDALKKKEASINKLERPYLSEDLKTIINQQLKVLEKNITDSAITRAQISFFDSASGQRALWAGSVLALDKENRQLLLDNNKTINIEDILDLEIFS